MRGCRTPEKSHWGDDTGHYRKQRAEEWHPRLRQAGWNKKLKVRSPEKQGFPGCTSGKGPTCQCRRHKRCRLDPWVRKISWRRIWQPTLVFLPGKSPWAEEPGRLHSIESQSWTWLRWLSTDRVLCVCMRERKDRARGKRKGELAMCTVNKWTAGANYLSSFTVCFPLRLTIHSLLQTSFWCCQLCAKHCIEY